MVPILAVIIGRKRDGGFSQWVLSGAAIGIVEKTQDMDLLALKKCPECAEQLSLSALLCDRCNYNFLSGSVAHRHKLLPAPSEPLAHDV
jgi:hypothetical protein